MKMDKSYRTAAVVLAAGSGKRMNAGVKKQYMEIADRPVLYYSLKAFEESFIDEIVLVVSQDEIEQVQESYVNRYSFQKISRIVAGGKERLPADCRLYVRIVILYLFMIVHGRCLHRKFCRELTGQCRRKRRASLVYLLRIR